MINMLFTRVSREKSLLALAGLFVFFTFTAFTFFSENEGSMHIPDGEIISSMETSVSGSYTFFDPVSGMPTTGYVLDTLCPGQTIDHCIQVVSDGSDHSIFSFSGNIGTVIIAPSTTPFDTCFSYTAPFIPSGLDIVTFTIENENGNTATIDITFAIANPNTEPNAGTPQGICASTTGTLTAVDPDPYSNNYWTVNSGGGTLTTPNSTTTGVTGLSLGNNVFLYMQEYPCGDVTIAATQITVFDGAAPDADAGPDAFLCSDNPNYVMQGNDPGEGASGVWEGILGSFTMASIADPTTSVSNIAIGVNCFEWNTDNGPCPGDPTVDQMCIFVYDNNHPAPDPGPDQEFCSTEFTQVDLSANEPVVPAVGFWTLVSGSGLIDDDTQANTFVTNLGIGDNVFAWNIDNGPCGVETEEIIITVYDGDLANTIEAGPNAEYCVPTSTHTMAASSFDYPATGVWSLDSGSGVITDINDPTTEITNLGIGDNVFIWTSNNGPCDAVNGIITDSVVITIFDDNQLDASAGSDAEYCIAGLGGLTMTANEAFYPAFGEWTVGAGTATFTDDEQHDAVVTGLSIGDNELIWTIDNGVCSGITTDTLVITVFPSTTDDAVAGLDQEFCTPVATYDLQATPAEYPATGEWTVISGVGSFADSNDPNTTVSGLVAGIHVYRWSVSVGPCGGIDSFDEVTITVFDEDALEANAGSNQSYCNDSGNTLTVDLNGSILTNPQTGIWTVISGSGTFTDETVTNPTVSDLSVGDNVFQWEVFNGPCIAGSSSDQVTITVFPYDQAIANAGEDQDACSNSSSTTLEGNSYDYPTTGVWTVINGSGIFVDETDPTTIVTGMSVGINTFVWTLTNSPCIPLVSSDEVVITVYNVGQFSVDAGEDQEVCSNIGVVTLDGNEPLDPATGLWQTTGTGTGDFADPSLFNTTVSGMDIGENIFEWVITNGACGNDIVDSVSIFVFDNEAPSADAGDDQQLCNTGNQTFLEGNDPVGVAIGTWTLVSGSGIIDDVNDPNSLITGLGDGVNVFQWTIDNGSCLPNTSSDQVAIEVNDEGGPEAMAGVDQEFCTPITSTSLEGNTPVDPAIGEWTIVSSSSAIINTPSNPTTTITNLTVGTHIFKWSIDNGACSDPLSEDEVSIFIFDDSQLDANAGPDQEHCTPPVTSVTLAGNAITSPAIGTWTQISGGTATIDDENDPLTTITGLTVGTYEFEWTIDNGPCGPLTTDQVLIHIYDDVNQQDANAGIDQELCSPASDTNLDGNAIISPAIGTWTSLGSASIDQANDPNTLVENLTQGDNLFVWEVYNFTCAGGITTDTVNVILFNNSQQDASAGIDQSLCTPDNSTFLDGNTYEYPATGVWTQTSGVAATIVDPTNPDTEVTGLSIGDNIFQWTIDNGPCAGMISSDQITISVFDDGAPQAEAGDNQELCSPESAAFMVADPAIDPGVGTWTLFSGTAVIEDLNDPITEITSMPIGTHVFVWTLNYETCGIQTDTVTIEVFDGTEGPSNAGIDQEFCTPIVSTLMDANEVTSPGYGTWSVAGGSGILSDENDPNATVSSLAIGENIFVWEVYNGDCLLFPLTTDTMSIFVYWNGQLDADAGEDQEICSLDNSAVLDGNEVTFPGSGSWTVFEGNGTFGDENLENTLVTDLAFGTNSFIWTIDNGPCGNSTDTVTVILVNELQDVAYAGEDQEFCTPLSTITLEADPALAGNTGTWTLLTSSTGITITNPSDPNTTVTGLFVGQHIFSWTISSSACADETSDNISVFVHNQFQADADAGDDILLCVPETTTNLNGNIPQFPAEGLWTYIGDGTATVTSPNNPLTAVENLEVGDNLFEYTLDNGPCGTSVDTLNVIVFLDINLEAFAGDDQELCLPATSAQLEGSEVVFPSEGMWTTTSTAVIIDPTNPNTLVTGLEVGDNEFIWTVLNGPCINSESADQVNIQVFDNTQQAAMAGPDQSICFPFESSETMAANDVIYPAIGVWTAMDSGDIVNPNNPNTTINNLEVGTNGFVWTIDNGPCEGGITMDTIFVLVYNNSADSANAGADAEYCLPDNIHTLMGNELVDPGTGLWTQITEDTPAVITDPTSSTTDVTGLNVGIYQFVWNVDNGPCGSSTDTLTVTVFPETGTGADTGPNQELCTPENSTFLEGNEADYPGYGYWELQGELGSDIVIVDMFDPNSEVLNLDIGEHIFTWTIYNGPCSEGDFFYIDIVNIYIFDETQDDAEAGPDQELCAPDECVTMAANIAEEPAIGYWTFLGDYIVSYSNINDPNAEVCGLQIGLNEFTWTIFNGPCQDAATVDTMMVLVFTDEIPLTYAGEDQFFCSPIATTTITADPIIEPNTGFWEVAEGSGTFTDPTNNSTTVDGLTVGINTYVWNVYNGPCPNSIFTDTVSVYVYDVTHPDPNAGPDLELCLPNNFTLTQAEETILPAVGSWAQIEGITASIVEPNNANTLITDLSMGTNTFVWSVNNGPCDPLISDTMSILVFADELNIAEAGTDIEICSPASSVILDATPTTDPTTGTWTFISGVASIDDVNNPNAELSALTVGCYEMQWSVYNGPCIENNAFDLVNICVFDANAPDAYAGEDVAICLPEDFLILDANAPIFPAIGTWTLTDGVGTIVNTHDPNTAFENLAAGINTLTWTIDNGPCGSSVDTLLIQINDPDVPLAYAGEDQELCELGGATLVGSDATYPATVWWEELTFWDTEISTPDQTTTTVFNLGIAENIFMYTVDNGACGVSTDTVSLFLNDVSIATADAGPDIVWCGELEEFFMQGSLTGNTSAIGEWAIVNGSGLIADINDPITAVYDIPVGINTFEWSVDNLGCGISSDLMTVTIFDPEIDSAYAGMDSVVCFHNMVPFELEANEVIFPAIGSWEILEGDIEIEDATDPNTMVNYLGEIIDPLTTVDNYIVWTIDNGVCGIYSDTLELILDDCITVELPDAFSPNGDGINDLFEIGNIINYPDNKVTIFNRWGDLIYSAAPYNNDWDGTSQEKAAYGELLPTSTYYIILELGDDYDPISGFIYLKR